jgi:repressor LexA
MSDITGWRTRKVYAFLEDYIAANHISPSLKEIAAAVGLASQSTVSYQLALLERAGYIRRGRYQARTIQIVGADERGGGAQGESRPALTA